MTTFTGYGTLIVNVESPRSYYTTTDANPYSNSASSYRLVEYCSPVTITFQSGDGQYAVKGRVIPSSSTEMILTPGPGGRNKVEADLCYLIQNAAKIKELTGEVQRLQDKLHEAEKVYTLRYLLFSWLDGDATAALALSDWLEEHSESSRADSLRRIEGMRDRIDRYLDAYNKATAIRTP